MTADDAAVPRIASEVPTSARAYGWMLGGKDNFESDREFIRQTLVGFPECVDIARQNRYFLYRAVRFLVQEAGIRQFLDLGCGLPDESNVHDVARRFEPEARVVYVDSDPIVLAHGRALLAADERTTVISADFRDPTVLEHPDARRLLDLSEPMAVLFFSVGHHLKDDPERGRAFGLRSVLDDVAAPASYLAFSQVSIRDPAKAAAMSEAIDGAGIPWQTRTPDEIDTLFTGLEPVEPGLVNIRDWRPDPDQPELQPVPRELLPYVGATDGDTDVMEYGGVLRKP